MTAQISDTFLFKGEKYELVGVTGGNLATPQQFGMEPEMLHTACYRGFHAIYELTDEVLHLREMTLREKNGMYLPIGEVEPVLEKFQATYNDLGQAIPYTGKIRLAKDFISDLYIHMGYQKASAFRTVIDITLQFGLVIEINDRSIEMEQKRGAFKEHYEAGNMHETIADAFSLDMDLE